MFELILSCKKSLFALSVPKKTRGGHHLSRLPPPLAAAAADRTRNMLLGAAYCFSPWYQLSKHRFTPHRSLPLAAAFCPMRRRVQLRNSFSATHKPFSNSGKSTPISHVLHPRRIPYFHISHCCSHH
jgi:hypothetical protein